MSSESREHLISEIGMESARWQEDVQRFDASAAALLGVNATDLRCAFLLSQSELTAKDLAVATGLTPGAVTTVIDRLEEAGLARRRHDAADRRVVRVELTPDARKKIQDIWGPMAQEGGKLMAGYSTDELRLLREFLVRVRVVQLKHTKRIEERRRGPGSKRA